MISRISLAIFTFLFVSLSLAGPQCTLLFSGDFENAWKVDPKLALSALLTAEGGGLRNAATRFRISRIRLAKNVSENELRLLIRSLFEVRYGEMNKYRMITKTSPEILDAQISRLLAEEMGLRGLKAFYESRSQLRPKDSLYIRYKGFMSSSQAEMLFSMLSTMSLRTAIPFVTLPRSRTFELSKVDVETLLLEGRESRAGRQVMARIAPRLKNDFAYALFARTFNRASFILGLYLMILNQDDSLKNVAMKNGDRLLKELEARIDAVSDLLSDETLTRADIEFDETVKRLTAANGPLSISDLLVVCQEIAAPNRCR